MKIDLQSFKQEKKSVAEYEVGFNKVVRFVPHVAYNELEKASQFRQGLKPSIRKSGILFSMVVESEAALRVQDIRVPIHKAPYRMAPKKQSRQKSYADVRRRDLEFAVGDQVLLRVSPIKGVVRFGVSGKLSPRYIGPFTILARVGSLAYRLQLPDSMAGVHPVFHVSMLRKFLRDPDHQIKMEPIAVQQDLTLECRPVRILESLERVMRKRSIKYVKVLWTNQSEREATWELEELMRQKYPELFVLGEFY
ncbi:uncharacterized protein [Zea mays]|uniref:uncharacterized protein n=1 Tax=Zea mays TaxID=4577 RepID=UPI0016521429|nr:uncharacterized protein LOC118472286 [Zea mays]